MSSVHTTSSYGTHPPSTVTAFPWPFVYPHPATNSSSSSSLPPSQPPPAATPNFDAVLQHIACSASSPLVRASTGAFAPNGGSAGSQRIRGFDVLPRVRAESLRCAWETLAAAQKRYFATAILHAQVDEAVAQLQAQYPPSSASPSGRPTHSYEHAVADNQTALVGDLACLWHLAQSESFLRLDGEDAITSSKGSTEATLYGLDWAKLCAPFKPASSAIPLAPTGAASIAHAAAAGARSHSFADPTTSALGSSLQSLLLPELENRLRERAEQLWQDFDPMAEERRHAEEEAEQATAANNHTHGGTAAATIGGLLSAGIGESIEAEEIAAHTAGLPPLDSNDLPSLLSHRLARLHARDAALQRMDMLLARTEAAHQAARVSSLAATAVLLNSLHLGATATGAGGGAGAAVSTVQQQKVHTDFLVAKLEGLSAKSDKVATEVARDTYLGLPAATHTHTSTGASSATLILPSLRVIAQTLDSVRATKAAELKDKTRQLNRYRALGSELTQLAAEMADLQGQIAHKQWMRDQVEQGKGDARQEAESTQGRTALGGHRQ